MIKMAMTTQAPDGWALCNGAMLQVADYPELFEIIGTRFGGDGEATFALPKLEDNQPGEYLMRVKITPQEVAAFKPMVSQMVYFAGDGIPENWMACDGRLLKVAEYPLLARLMGNRWGGDGTTEVALPNFPQDGPIRMLICISGIDPSEGMGDDDDDY